MTDILGPRQLRDIALPSAIDAGEVLRISLQDGTTAEQAIATAAAAIGAVNEQIRATYGNYFYITNQITSFTRQAVNSTMTPKRTELVQPRSRRGSVTGWMLNTDWFGDALDWTPRYLESAWSEQLDADVQEIAEAFLNRFDYDWTARILNDGEVGVGTAGYAPGWAIGTGTNTNYIPPAFRNKQFSSTHTHYVFKDDTSLGWADVFDALMENELEHGITSTPDSPFDIFVSPDDLAEIILIDGFVPLIPENMTVVSSGADNPRNPFVFMGGVVEGIPGSIVGYYRSELKGVARLIRHERTPTNYCYLLKGFGFNNRNNPLAIRIPQRADGFGMVVKPELVMVPNPELNRVLFDAEYGVNVNNRLMGGAGYLYAGAAAWADATIT